MFLNILYSLGSIQSIPHIFIIYYKGHHVKMFKSYNITTIFYPIFKKNKHQLHLPWCMLI